MADFYQAEQQRYAYLQSLLRSDPFAYEFLYGAVSPQVAVQSGGIGALRFGAPGLAADPQAAIEEARKKYGNDVFRIRNQNPLPTEESAGEPAATTPEAATYSGPSAFAKLSGLLPSGFDQTALPGTFADPFVNTALAGKRGKAEEFISRMLGRGTATPTGAGAARTSLASQEPGVMAQLRGIADVQLENERSKLRGIAAPGYAAAEAPGETGENFDPNPYKASVDTDLAQFQQAFPGAYNKSVGEAGDLFNTAGLGGTAGAVSGPQNLSYDPYAVEGGKLKSGLEEGGEAPPAKRRTTAVF